MEEAFVAEKRKIRYLRTSILLYISMLVAISFTLFSIAEKYTFMNPVTAQSEQILLAFVKACAVTFGISAVAIPLKMLFSLILDLAKIGEGENTTAPTLFENPDDFYSSVHSDDKRIKLAETIALYLSTQKAGETLEAICPYIEAAYFFSYIALFSATSNPAFVFIGTITVAILHSVYSKLCCVYADTQINKVLENLSITSTNYTKKGEKDVKDVIKKQ